MNYSLNQKILIHCQHMINTMKKEEYKELRKNNYEEYRQKLQDKYIQLFNKSISLFNMLIDDGENFDINKLKRMLNLSDKELDGKISYDKASEQWGQSQFNEYAKHVVDKTPPNK
jgi:hypothetical protein